MLTLWNPHARNQGLGASERFWLVKKSVESFLSVATAWSAVWLSGRGNCASTSGGTASHELPLFFVVAGSLPDQRLRFGA